MEKAILIEGAREHNLRDISCRIPKDAITVITGPSGSGKTSLALDTLLAEGAFRMRTLAGAGAASMSRPKLTAIRGLSPIAALERRPGSAARQTVAGYLGIGELLRLLVKEHGRRPCLTCGKGVIVQTSRDDAIDRILRDLHGENVAIAALLAGGDDLPRRLEQIARRGFALLLQGGSLQQMDSGAWQPAAPGEDVGVVIDRMRADDANRSRLHEAIDLAAPLQQAGIAVFVLDGQPDKRPRRALVFSEEGICGACGHRGIAINENLFGFRIAAAAEDYRGDPAQLEGAQGLTQAEHQEFLAMRLGEASLAELLGGALEAVGEMLPDVAAAVALKTLCARAEGLGLGHLALLRSFASLSFGEAQRMRLLSTFACRLTGMIYVIDEPSLGLHPLDLENVRRLLREVSNSGNTLVLVEHDMSIAARADHIVMLGPGAGKHGGELLYEGVPAGCRFKLEPPRPSCRDLEGHAWIEIAGASQRNLKDAAARFPIGAVSCIVGVSGSGKSTLVFDSLAPALARIASGTGDLDDDACRRLEVARVSCPVPLSRVIASPHLAPVINPLSFVATYIGLFSPLRDFFARLPQSRLQGLRPSSFSLRAGGCRRCKGSGVDMAADEWANACAACEGKRFAPELLRVRYRGLSIADVLDLSAEEAEPLIGFLRGCRPLLDLLKRFHLDYLPLGQALPTLSDGEVQRLQLIRELAEQRVGSVYIFEEPTTGLDEKEVDNLVDVFRELASAGNTILAIEHRLRFIAVADYLVELGPGAGAHGGEVVAVGPPADVEQSGTTTGTALKRYLKQWQR